MAKSKESPIVIKIPGGGENKSNQLHAYVVDNTGKVIAAAPFKGTEASISLSKNTVKASRVYIGHAFPKEFPAAKINARMLNYIGAHQVTLNFTNQNLITIPHLPVGVSPLPEWFLCGIAGSISNTVILNGLPVTGPLCNARVHICNVEWVYRWPVWLQYAIPAAVLVDLQTRIAATLAPGFVPPVPDPGPVDGSNNLEAESLVLRKKVSGSPAPIPESVYNEIQSATTNTIHAIIYNYHDILYPYLCWWPFIWEWFYYTEEETVVNTDCNGHFDASLFRFPEYPWNIYIWVEMMINGQWVTVYRPFFPCNTNWSYACGTDININLADQNIPPCNCGAEVPEGSVWFTGIGQYGIALNIQQDETNTVSITQPTAAPASPQPVSIHNVGCTNFADPNQLSPFGSTLDFWLAFGSNPPAYGAQPATHYRWVMTLIKDSNLNNIAAPASNITGAVSRYYMWQDTTTNQWHSGAIVLQDTDVNNAIAYQIPKYDVTLYAGVPGNAEWESFNFISNSIDSNSIPNGYLARFDLQLLYNDPVNGFTVLSVPTSSFQVSQDTNVLDGSVPAPYTASGAGQNYLTLDPSINGNALNLSLKVRIDNSQVIGSVNDVWLLDGSGNPVPGGNSGPCGFIIYNDPARDVRISFNASEPFNFANFSFQVWIGDSGNISPETQSGYVFSNVGIYTLASGTFSTDVSITDLLGSCVGKAAYGVYMDVHSLATDGTNPLWIYGGKYYASGDLAFALSNQ